MSRLIDADAFVRFLKDTVKKQEYENLKIDELLTVADVIEAIISELDGTSLDGFKNAPTIEPEPKWIPCSERLPEAKEKYCWVCTDTGYQCQCRWTNINHFWTDLTTEWHWHIMDTPQYSKVTAWMPLPEPYGGEQE